MARRATPAGTRTAAAIHRAGLHLIYRRGYEAMSLRELAAEVGIKAASLYNHIQTKQDLLFDLIRTHMDALLVQTDAALARAPAQPEPQLCAFIAHHITYHLDKKAEVFVANFELRALEPAYYRTILGLRRAYEARLIAILDAGTATGDFTIPDTHVAAYAILAMLTGACTWYKPEGRLSKTAVVDLHTGMVLDGFVGRHAPGSGSVRTGVGEAARPSGIRTA